MPRIVIILLLLLILVYLAYRFKRMQLHRQKQLTRYLLIVIFILLMIGLAVSGRLNWIIALIGAVLPALPKLFSWVIRWFPSIAMLLKNSRIMKANQGVEVLTRYLRVNINRTTGEMLGLVLEGGLRNKKLSDLSLQQLLELLTVCHQQDSESAALLMAYLHRYHPEWRNSESYQHQPDQFGGFKAGVMGTKEAREILAVEENASREDIIQAHRNLLQKIHPDRGGSDYLAAKINQARDTLLKK